MVWRVRLRRFRKLRNIENDPRISDEVSQQVGVAVDGTMDFVDSDQVAVAATNAGLDQALSDTTRPPLDRVRGPGVVERGHLDRERRAALHHRRRSEL